MINHPTKAVLVGAKKKTKNNTQTNQPKQGKEKTLQKIQRN